MATDLVDSNILLDVLTENEEWFEWSSAMLERCGREDLLVINPIIYAEASVRFSQIDDFEAALGLTGLGRLPLPWDAAFLAGKCFRQYRGLGGPRESILPDFFIGAHATVAGMALITRDVRRFRSYFPKLKLIAPD